MENHHHALTLTVEQAAQALGIGRSTAYELVHTGDLPSLRLGRRIVIPATRSAELLGASSRALLENSDTAEGRWAAGEPEDEGAATPNPLLTGATRLQVGIGRYVLRRHGVVTYTSF